MKKILFILILLNIAFAPVVNAQSKKIQKANKFLEAGEYLKALDLYVKLYPKAKTKEDKALISYNAGMCSRYMFDSQNSIKWFKRAILHKYQNPLMYLYLADALKIRGQYDEARQNYSNFKDLMPNDPRGADGVVSCDLSKEWIAKPTKFIVAPMGIINSKDNDFAPAFGGDTNTVFFTTTRSSTSGTKTNYNSGANFADIYFSTKDKKGTWTVPVPVAGGVNTAFDDGSSTLEKDGRTIYYTSCHIAKDKKMGCKIFVSKYAGDQWGAPELLKVFTDTAISVGQPCLSHDDLTLYFVSDDKKGLGGKDIWRITRSSKTSSWSSPENLGSEINTQFDELFPSVDNQGNLYFATDGRIGMGGLDIYKATKKEGGWVVENMKSPINSSSNDFGIIFNPIDNNTGFFSSSRNSGRGDDVFSFYQKPLLITLKGYVINESNNAYLFEVDIEITGSDGSMKKVKTDDKGSFSVNLKEGVDYMVLTSKKTFLKATGSVSTKGVKEDGKVFEKTLYMKPSIGTIKIPNIRYDFNDTVLREESKVALDELVELLNLNATITIELRAHTDYRGGEKDNQRLSQGRANSVVAYLISKGIKNERLVAKGYGKSQPVVVDEQLVKTYPFLTVGQKLDEKYIKTLPKEQQEICNELNRRTEFTVLSENYGPNYDKFGDE
jgi:peptidoglycan-associated lipoprotein